MFFAVLSKKERKIKSFVFAHKFCITLLFFFSTETLSLALPETKITILSDQGSIQVSSPKCNKNFHTFSDRFLRRCCQNPDLYCRIITKPNP